MARKILEQRQNVSLFVEVEKIMHVRLTHKNMNYINRCYKSYAPGEAV